MNKKNIILLSLIAIFIVLTSMGIISFHSSSKDTDPQKPLSPRNVQKRLVNVTDSARHLKVKKTVITLHKPVLKASGVIKDSTGKPMKGIIVSDSYSCVQTDAKGHFTIIPDAQAKFIYYTVPADCEVPIHSPTDHTAYFYQKISGKKKNYNFILKKLPGGKENDFKLIVFGDPQVTNAFNPYYIDATDNPIKKSDIARFTDETMVDVKRTIARLPKDIPVYGLSMGDDVQYYGGYNATLEQKIREALGSSDMRLFSVIGNHDQDNKPLYQKKWEDTWGPEDYSFNRGDIHFVCFNNVHFYHGGLYYQPGELTNAQMAWLKKDLSFVNKNKKVILNYHIPLTFGNRPYQKAIPLDIESEKGHYRSSRLVEILHILSSFKGGYELFCGHTHFALNHEINYHGLQIMEHCHAAACGNIWQSNINICGTPNGYYVYTFNGTQLTNCYYKGTFWEADKQMSLFRAETNFNNESYSADWNLPKDKHAIIANVFNADSHWRIIAIEDGIEYDMTRINSKGQDAFAAGYHHKYSKSVSYGFISKKNGYLIMNHLYYYIPKNPYALITIKATDEYGNTYTSTTADIVTEPFFNYAHYYK
jgi:hypothetical protein